MATPPSTNWSTPSVSSTPWVAGGNVTYLYDAATQYDGADVTGGDIYYDGYQFDVTASAPSTNWS